MVIYDAEHFFDGYKDRAGYALSRLAGRPGGRRRPARPVRHERRHAAVGDRGDRPGGPRDRFPVPQIGIHPHDDAECGVANALAAVRRGPMQVQGTVNG